MMTMIMIIIAGPAAASVERDQVVCRHALQLGLEIGEHLLKRYHALFPQSRWHHFSRRRPVDLVDLAAAEPPLEPVLLREVVNVHVVPVKSLDVVTAAKPVDVQGVAEQREGDDGLQSTGRDGSTVY